MKGVMKSPGDIWDHRATCAVFRQWIQSSGACYGIVKGGMGSSGDADISSHDAQWEVCWSLCLLPVALCWKPAALPTGHPGLPVPE